MEQTDLHMDACPGTFASPMSSDARYLIEGLFYNDATDGWTEISDYSTFFSYIENRWNRLRVVATDSDYQSGEYELQYRVGYAE